MGIEATPAIASKESEVQITPFPWEREGGLSEVDVAPIDFSDDIAEFGHTSRFLFRRLFHPSSRVKTYLTLGAILGASIALEHNKTSIQEDLSTDRSSESNRYSSTVKRLGNAGTVPALALLLYTGGKVFGSSRAHESGMMMLESALYTGLFTGLGKFVLSEDRPDDGGELHLFRAGGHGISGHASIAASISAPLSRGLFRINPSDGHWKRFGKRLGKGVAYGMPALTGLSRIHDDRHYAWNVVLGLALGYSIGDTVVDAHESRREKGRSRWAPDSVGPLVTEDGSGIALRWQF